MRNRHCHPLVLFWQLADPKKRKHNVSEFRPLNVAYVHKLAAKIWFTNIHQFFLEQAGAFNSKEKVNMDELVLFAPSLDVELLT